MQNHEVSETEQKILNAATQVFHQKGFNGARMQEIADLAGINKALLHYYFRNKEALFGKIIQVALQRLIPPIIEIWLSQKPFKQKIQAFVKHYIQTVLQNPEVPAFVIHEINQNPQHIIDILGDKKGFPTLIIYPQIQTAIDNGEIAPIAPIDLMLNMISMCLMPFVGKNLFQHLNGLSDAEYLAQMEMRATTVADFILNALKPQRS